MAQRIQFGFYNRADTATLSGGSWLAGAPLANLQQRLLSLRARSTNDAESSTRIDVDFGVAPPLVQLVAFARHNLGIAATYRITAGTTLAGTDVYDSGVLDVWPALYLPEDRPYETDNWFNGRATAAELAGYPISLRHLTGAIYKARYWRIQFSDTDNPDTYVEVARLWMGPLWQPIRNYEFGASLAWEPRSVSEYSLGGVLYTDTRNPARVMRLRLPMLSQAEAYGELLDAQRRLGTEGELWVIPNADDAARSFKRDFMARFRRIDPIAQFANRLHDNAIELEELL